MTSCEPIFINSRDNPLIKDLRRLAQDSHAYRKQSRVWIEGAHLCSAAWMQGWQPAICVVAKSDWPVAVQSVDLSGVKVVVIADALMAYISALESPARMGLVLDLASPRSVQANVPTVVLDRVQDAGNVGAILRSAAAFGFKQVLSLKGSAALWSPKVLRAGMGANFALQLNEGLSKSDLQALEIPILMTSSRDGELLHLVDLPWPCAWVFGHEGQGVQADLAQLATKKVHIAQPGGQESLNVAAAAAICLHASAICLTPS